MKILDLCEFFSERGGGVRSYLTKQLRAVTRRGHEMVVVAPGPRDEEVALEGGRLVRYAGPPLPYDPTYHAPLRVDRMRALVRRERPDVLQVSSPFLPAVVARTLGEVPLRVYVHHADPIGCYVEPFAERWLPGPLGRAATGPAWAWLRNVCSSVDGTVVAGHWLERLLAQKGCQRVATVPFGIDHEDFGPEKRDPALRARLLGPLAGDPAARLVLVAGRLAADKRQEMLVDAVRRAARARPLALVVLGDGPERARLQSVAAGFPSTFMKFTRDRAEYAALLASADVLLHGSRCETYGFVLVETLASGTPVVVPDRGGAGALARPEFSETYAADGGAGGTAAALLRILGRDPQDLRGAARREALAHPSTEAHFDALLEYFARRLRERRYSVAG